MKGAPQETARAAGAIASGSAGVTAGALSLVAAGCCVSPVIAPILVSVLGASGVVWAAGLKPYSGWILTGAAACLAYGFWTVYRPQASCAVPATRMQRVLPRIAKVTLWVGSVCWTAALLLQLLLP